MIRIEGVSKSFDSKRAVDGIDLEVPAGSVFGLIGPNGAGKTTTLKMLATLIKPETGRILIDGRDVREEVRLVRRTVGYMPDRFGTFRGLSCEEYLEFFGRLYGFGGRDLSQRIDAVLSLTDLDRVREEITTALSTGMAQRLSLAKTLLHDPRVLILDEPASGLDPRARIEIRSLLKELGTMGKTVVISSHILADLEEICTDIGIMEEGKMVWSGSLKAMHLDSPMLAVIVEVAEGDRERAAEILRANERAARVAVTNGRIEIDMNGRHGNDLLRALLDAGIEVASFSQRRTSLEAIFLERTKGIVS